MNRCRVNGVVASTGGDTAYAEGVRRRYLERGSDVMCSDFSLRKIEDVVVWRGTSSCEGREPSEKYGGLRHGHERRKPDRTKERNGGWILRKTNVIFERVVTGMMMISVAVDHSLLDSDMSDN